MIKYICKNCNDLECETSVCPICGQRTEISSTKVYWCSHCNAPSFYPVCQECGENCKLVGTDLRPVFPEERLLLEIVLGVKPLSYAESSVWNMGSNYYLIDGVKKTINYSKIIKNSDSDKIISELIKYGPDNQKYVENFFETETIRNFIEINKSRLNMITYEAIEYIRKETKGKDVNEMFVSFSGGKDSTVVSDLVLNALDKSIIHIYGDTTLEYPESAEYIKRFRKDRPSVPMLIAKNKDQDFNNLCEVIGPPARLMRWCCTIFKTGAITKKIDSTFKNQKQVIAFQGIRRSESIARSKYERESNESKIKKQIAVNPIIDWTDFDVWLYILSNKIDFNYAYRQGFSRVGCWCCPNNTSWSEFLSSIYMHDQYIEFRNILYKFAQKIGKPDWKVYIDDGEWKKRQGGNGVEMAKNSIVSFKPCALEENTYNFELTKPMSDELYKFFKPFGKLNFDMGKKLLNEVYVLDRKTNMPLLRLSGKTGSNVVKIAVVGENKNFTSKKTVESLLKNQINKYQTCIGCTYCEAVCRFDAIKVFNIKKGNVSCDTISYTIDENKCVGCLECVKHFPNGCYINKVLRVKKD